MRGFAEAMEVIPYTLAENAGLNPIAVVTDLRNRHALGEKNAGINVRKVPFIATVRVKKRSVLFAVRGISVFQKRCKTVRSACVAQC